MKSFTLSVSILMLLYAARIKGADLACTPDPNDKCRCTGSNFTLDLGGSFLQQSYQKLSDSENPMNYMILSPCVDYICGKNASRACQWDATGDGTFYVLGTAKEVMWSVGSLSDFTVTFGGGDPDFQHHIRQAKITCQISDKPGYSYDGEDKPQSDTDPIVYKFSVQAKSFAPVPNSGGSVVGLAGLIIIILLFMALALYFIIGSVVMYTAKGARGTEMIPNVSFWKDLPFLIKDGFVFTFGPCVNIIREKRGYSAL